MAIVLMILLYGWMSVIRSDGRFTERQRLRKYGLQTIVISSVSVTSYEENQVIDMLYYSFPVLIVRIKIEFTTNSDLSSLDTMINFRPIESFMGFAFSIAVRCHFTTV